MLQQHVKPDGIVIELGAGTGRLALKFVIEGLRVHAVEPAAAMRVILEGKLTRAGLTMSIEDALAATFVPPAGRVDVVIFPFNGLLHLKTRDEMVASFVHVHDVLADEGRFALDCTGPYWEAMLYGPMPWGRADTRVHHANGRTVLTCDRSSYDPATRQMRIDIRYLLQGEQQGQEIALHQTMWTWQQVLAALNEADFAIDAVYGDVDLAPFDEGSPRLLVSARKR